MGIHSLDNSLVEIRACFTYLCHPSREKRKRQNGEPAEGKLVSQLGLLIV